VEEEEDEGEEGRGVVVWVPGSVIRAHAVLGTDREKPVLGRVSRAAHVQLGIVDNGRKRTVRRDGASPLVSLSSFVFLFSPFSHRYPGGGTRNNSQTGREFDLSSGRILRLDDSPIVLRNIDYRRAKILQVYHTCAKIT